MAVTPDRWGSLGDHTPARVALGRAGGSAPTAALLRLRADHARARAAIDQPFDAEAVASGVRLMGLHCRTARSAVATRTEYVRRPDLGRSLDDSSLVEIAAARAGPCDLSIVACDGLSPGAVARSGAALIGAVAGHPSLLEWSLADVVVVADGRVAIGDQIGELLAARTVVVLIGERPGMSVPESIGAYITHDPRPGRTDAERNCVSNIHDHGLSIAAAADRIVAVLERARAMGRTGVDTVDGHVLDAAIGPEPAADGGHR